MPCYISTSTVPDDLRSEEQESCLNLLGECFNVNSNALVLSRSISNDDPGQRVCSTDPTLWRDPEGQ